MLNKTQLFPTLLFAFATIYSSAQSNFNQNDNTRIFNNPAFTGTHKSSSIDLNYKNSLSRSSWNNQTMAFSVDQYLGKGNGVSLSYSNHMLGNVYSGDKIAIAYSKQITFAEKHHLSIGGQANYFNLKQDWGSHQSSQAPSRNKTIKEANLSGGILYHSKYFFTGLAIRNLLKNNNDFFSSPLSYGFQVGGKIKVQEFSFIPYVQGSLNRGFRNVSTNLKTRYKRLELDLGYAINNGPTGGIGLKFDKWNIGYNYGSYVSRLYSYRAASTHEIRVGFQPTLFKKTNDNYIDF